MDGAGLVLIHNQPFEDVMSIWMLDQLDSCMMIVRTAKLEVAEEYKVSMHSSVLIYDLDI